MRPEKGQLPFAEIEARLLACLWGSGAEPDRSEAAAPLREVTFPRLYLTAWWVLFFPTPIFLVAALGWFPACAALVWFLSSGSLLALIGFVVMLLLDYALAVWMLRHLTRRWIVRLALFAAALGWFDIYFMGDVGGGRQWFGWGRLLRGLVFSG